MDEARESSTIDETISIQEAARRANEYLEQRQRERLTIALVGRGGCGKSSLINRLIGRKVCEVGASTDKTTTAEKHVWNQVVFVDLPGYGTRAFSLDRVMSEFEIKSFDMFLWCANGKFLEEDLSVYEKLKETGKPIIFVRTQCDAIYDDEKSNDELEEEITVDLHRLLKQRVDLLFVSSNIRYAKFRERLARLIEVIELHALEAGQAKASILYRDFRAVSREFLTKKKEAVADIVTMHSLIAAANGINIIPGLNIGVDLVNVVAMFKRITDAYGIDEIANANVMGSPPQWLLGARSLLQTVAADGAIALLRAVGGPAVVKQVGQYVPVLGMIISAGLGFIIVRDAGMKFLDDCHKTAEEFFLYSFKQD